MSWQRTRLKYLAAVPIVNGVGERAEFDDPDWPRYIRTTDIGGPTVLRQDTFVSLPPVTAALATVVRGDILMSAAGTVGRTYLHLSDDPACFAGYLVRFRPSSEVDPRFVSYWTQATPFEDQVSVGAVRSTIDNFSAGKYQNLVIDVPSQAAQRAIADYLDAETARIDRMVKTLDRLRTLLEARWHQVLDDEVLGRTSGREADEQAEASGPFGAAVGRWPANWTPQPLKRVLVANQSGVWGEDPTGTQDTVVLRSTDIAIDGAWTIKDPASRSLSVLEANAARLRIGDILVVTSSGSDQHIGKAALVDASVAGLNAAFSNFTQRLTTSKAADPKYVWYLLRSPFGREQLRWLSSTTTGLRNLSGRVLGAVTFPGPPLGQQRRIVSSLDEVRSAFDMIADRLDRQIGLLVERRQALITAAVTGQMDMPGVAA